jgi:glucosamine--fructose-6-phosphate aminotransferase (isomerizing)
VNSASQQVIDGPYLRDILDQPAALKDTLEGFRRNDALFSQIGEMRRKGHSRIVLTGMGSSLHALYPLELKLIAQGEIAMRADMSELIYSMPTLLESGALIVAVSQSGRSAEVVRLLEMRAQRWTVVGVTNTADSPLGSQADIVLLTHCGSEFSVSAKTYLGTLAALEIFGAAWCGEDREALYAELQPGPSFWMAIARGVAGRRDEGYQSNLHRGSRTLHGRLRDGRAHHQGINAFACRSHEQRRLPSRTARIGWP